MRYLVVIEESSTGFSAYSPDLPGCVATGATRDETEQEMTDAVALHLEGLQADGIQIPRPRSFYTYVDVPS